MGLKVQMHILKSFVTKMILSFFVNTGLRCVKCLMYSYSYKRLVIGHISNQVWILKLCSLADHMAELDLYAINKIRYHFDQSILIQIGYVLFRFYIRVKLFLLFLGVYMPYYNASKEHYEMYVETLDKIQVLIDSYAKDSPIMMCGDFNTVLPQHSLLRHSWYRQKPFNEYSLLLYDFMCNNNLITCNFNFEQPINFTYFKGQNSSYIDHVLVSKYLNESVLECSIVCNDVDCTSYHYPLRTRIQMYINDIEEQRKCSDSVHFYPKPEWNSPNFKILLVEY